MRKILLSLISSFLCLSSFSEERVMIKFYFDQSIPHEFKKLLSETSGLEWNREDATKMAQQIETLGRSLMKMDPEIRLFFLKSETLKYFVDQFPSQSSTVLTPEHLERLKKIPVENDSFLSQLKSLLVSELDNWFSSRIYKNLNSPNPLPNSQTEANKIQLLKGVVEFMLQSSRLKEDLLYHQVALLKRLSQFAHVYSSFSALAPGPEDSPVKTQIDLLEQSLPPLPGPLKTENYKADDLELLGWGPKEGPIIDLALPEKKPDPTLGPLIKMHRPDPNFTPQSAPTPINDWVFKE